MVSKPSWLRRAVPAFGLALIASIALSAAAAGSASAATQHWYVCHATKPTFGHFEDQFCSKAVKSGGNYEQEKLFGVTGLAMNGTSNFTLKWKVGGQFKVSCSSQSISEGTIENPSGGAAGTAHGTLLLSGCNVVEPSGCSVHNPIGIKVSGEATEFNGQPAVKFTPVGGGFELSLEGAKCAFRGDSYLFFGSFTGIYAAGSLEFTQASSALTVGAQPATLEGTSKIETSKGEALKVAP